jgi:hypothetical protein
VEGHGYEAIIARQVAIKTLPEEFAKDEERRGPFPIYAFESICV